MLLGSDTCISIFAAEVNKILTFRNYEIRCNKYRMFFSINTKTFICFQKKKINKKNKKKIK